MNFQSDEEWCLFYCHSSLGCRINQDRTGGSVVEHRAVTREVVSSTPTGPTLRVLK